MRSSSCRKVCGGAGGVRAELEVLDRGAGGVHSPSLGRPYTPSLPDDSSKAGAGYNTDADSVWNASTSINSNSLSSKDEGVDVHQLETPLV